MKMPWSLLFLVMPVALASCAILQNDYGGGKYHDYDIVFAKEVEGNIELFITRQGDGDTVRLTNTPSRGEMFPTWSSDGRRIVYVGAEEDEPGIYVLEVKTGVAKRVLAGFPGAIPSWSPDGKQLVLQDASNGIVIADLATGESRAVPHGAERGAYATWSKAGPHLVFEGAGGIFRTNTDGANTRRLTSNPGLNEWPRFSPDGSQVAYASGSEEEKHLWVVDADGTEARQLTSGIMYGDAYATWSPDGKTILITASDGERAGIYEVNVRDGKTRFLMEGMAPDWR